MHQYIEQEKSISYWAERALTQQRFSQSRSITDPCLGWEDTEGFVKELAEVA